MSSPASHPYARRCRVCSRGYADGCRLSLELRNRATCRSVWIVRFFGHGHGDGVRGLAASDSDRDREADRVRLRAEARAVRDAEQTSSERSRRELARGELRAIDGAARSDAEADRDARLAFERERVLFEAAAQARLLAAERAREQRCTIAGCFGDRRIG